MRQLSNGRGGIGALLARNWWTLALRGAIATENAALMHQVLLV